MSLSQVDAYLILCGQKGQAAIRKALLNKSAVEYVEKDLAEEVAKLEKKKSYLAKNKIQFVAPCDEAWPQKFTDLGDYPLGVFYKGDIEALGMPTVAIVGTRRATVYGVEFAKTLAKALTARGINVLSGLALGIDSAAHAGALAAKGMTTGVLGCGIDKIYPHENKELFAKVETGGLLLSEFEPGVSPSPSTFPRRNRIVAALADAVVVVESEEKGGAMITARLAQKLGRPLFALPGRVDNPFSCGSHNLIREGATLIASVESFLDDFASITSYQQSEMFAANSEAPRTKTKGPRALDPFLQGDALLPEEFASQSSMSFAEASAQLMQLELDGFIAKRLDGRYEIREPDHAFGATSR